MAHGQGEAGTVMAEVVVRGVDHLVLKVADQEVSLAFYLGELGLHPWRVEEWRRGEVGFPSARVSDTFILDFVAGAPDGTNLDHFCLVVEKTDLEKVKNSGHLRVQSGPGQRSGARGDGMSLYVLDPDDNVIELRYYD